MSNIIVPGVYTAVMKDVIENVKKDFKDSGIDETVLHELEHNWLQKLKSFKVASWNHNDGNVGEETNGSTTSVPFILPAATTTTESTTNVSSKYPPNPNEFETPPPAAANLPTLATSTLSPHIKKFQSYSKDAHVYTDYSNNPNHLNNNHHHHNNNINNHNINHNNNNNNNNNLLTQSQTQSLSSSSSSSISSIPPPPTNTPQKTYPDTYEKKRKDSITKRKLYVDEDDINSDLDDSDEDEGAAEGEFQNIILCLYDKVTRTKNKWKCQLKDGIMSVNGKEYLFQKGNGDFEF